MLFRDLKCGRKFIIPPSDPSTYRNIQGVAIKLCAPLNSLIKEKTYNSIALVDAHPFNMEGKDEVIEVRLDY